MGLSGMPLVLSRVVWIVFAFVNFCLLMECSEEGLFLSRFHEIVSCCISE